MTTATTLVLADVVVGAVLVAASLGRWRTSSGALLLVSGGAWWIGSLVAPLTFLHRGVLIHLVLTHPGGPLSGAVRATVVTGYVYASVPPVASDGAASLTMAAAVVGMAAHRHLVTTGPRRQSTAFALAAAGCLAAALAVGPVSRMAGIGSEATVLGIYDVLVVSVALLVLGDVVRLGSARGALTGLVVDLGRATGSDVLQARLAAGLGDPELAVGYWLPSTQGYVDDTGRPIELPGPGDPRAVTPLQVNGQPIAVLIHSSAAPGDPRLLAEVAAAARWAVGNVALRAQVREQVEGVEASRRRIVTAADSERARLEHRLQQGPGRRLQRVADLIAAEGSLLCGLTSDVDRARAQVEGLARGLHPRTLTEHGLAEALQELAAGAPLPVRLEVPAVRLPASLEVTLFFTCAEALANVLKHAQATQVDVRVACDEHSAAIVVADDGVGGADPQRGTGLRGLTDRVEALDGHVEVQSPVGGGTRLEVTLPMSAEPMIESDGAPAGTAAVQSIEAS